MDKQYFCSGRWFSTYDKAKNYSDSLMEGLGIYYVVYTKAEVDSITNAIDKTIDHELECGK